MNTSAWVIPVVIALLVAGVFFAGCSDASTTTSDSTAQITATTSAAASGALYSEGDIVKNPKSTVNSGLLIISYDSATDMYERATVYPYSDGSWGYRVDSKTSKITRANLEKAYTEKIKTVTVSSITIGAPTTATTVATTATTKTTTVATTATTSSLPAPRIQDMDPFIGTAGTTVTIKEINGLNFASGATLLLTKSGESSINATGVSVSSSTLMTCKFVIPLGTTAGTWNVVVTNPDKQYYTYSNQFTIYKNNTVSASTTTTSTTATSTVKITGISPSPITLGGYGDTKEFTIMGTNMSSSITGVKLTKSGSTITGSYIGTSSTEARAIFTIPAGSTGTWTVVAVDSSGTELGSLTDGLTIQ